MTASTRELPRMLAHYRETIVPALQSEFDFDNVMQIPRLTKIVVNMGVGEATRDAKLMDGAHVDDDLRQTRDLHDVVEVELRLQGRNDGLAVVGEHAGQLAGGCAHVQRSLPVRRETRMLRPSSSLR